MHVGVSSTGRTWVTMGPLGWATVGVFVLLPYYTAKYLLIGMWWLFVTAPIWAVRAAHQWKLERKVDEERQARAAQQREQSVHNRDSALGPWPGVSTSPKAQPGPRDWSSHQ